MKLQERVESVSQPKTVPVDVAKAVRQGTFIHIDRIEQALIESEDKLRKLSFRLVTADVNQGRAQIDELSRAYEEERDTNLLLRQKLEQHEDTLRLVEPRAS